VKDLIGRVAVITGAASGIGRGLATRCLEEGMHVVLADIDDVALQTTTAELRDGGGDVIAVPTDVSIGTDVEHLAEVAVSAFGAVHLVCSNAGVGLRGLTWERTQQDWEWLLGVNLWGAIHGVRVFVPLMLAQGDEGHVVNTASIAGLIPAPFSALYNTSKYAVVALSESLALDLEQVGARVNVSVLCPGFVQSGIVDAGRARPARLANAAEPPIHPDDADLEARTRAGVAAGMPPAGVAAMVFAAIRAQRFWVLPHPAYDERIRTRTENLLAEARADGQPVRG
jgi:NAD(P)-dependent dehydrogenase (short-subunit alcohol dehydrogenase family)